MKTLKMFLIAMVLALAAAPSLHAQTKCGAGVSGCARTTLSSAQASGASNKTFVVASATGITASTNTGFNLATGTGGEQYCLIGRELEKVTGVSGTTITAIRGSGSTLASGHISGAQVICGLGGGSWNPNTGGSQGVFMSGNGAPPSGACTRASAQFLPIFQITSPMVNGFTYDCLGGEWVQGTLPDAPDPTPLVLASNIGLGQVAYSSVGTNTTDIATVEWLTSIYVAKTGYVTGIKFLCANTCTTDKALGILRDSNGAVLANAAVAGLLVSGANTFQTQAFTAPIFVVGPALYFVGIQGNGTAAGFVETLAASTFVDVVTGQLTGGTFGTIVNPATMPTTFTAGNGPVVELYY